MKKIAILLAMALVIGTMAWGQASTAAGLSAGLFTQDADSIVNPRFYNPDLGNFLFFSAAPNASSAGTINMGYATQFSNIYLGVQLRGALLSGQGARDKGIQEEPKDDINYPNGHTGWEPETIESFYNRDINLSVLVGMANMGFLLGVTVPGETSKVTVVGKTDKDDGSIDALERIVTSGTRFDLGWGMKGTLAPFVTVSYKFPGLDQKEATETTDKENVNAVSFKTTSGSYFGIRAGADYALDEGKTVGGELTFTNYFPAVSQRSFAGTIENGDKTELKDSEDKYGGTVSAGINAFYKQTITMDTVSIGFKPQLDFSFSNESRSWTGDVENKTNFGERRTDLSLTTAVGMKWQVREKLGLLAGTNIRLFQWNTRADTGTEQEVGEKQASLDARESGWTIYGVNVGAPTLGLSFTPTEKLNIGLNIKPFINGLFFNDNFGTNDTRFDFSVSLKL